MKAFSLLLIFAFFSASYAITVEEAWENYKANPKKPENPSWVEDIPSFEKFKERWDTVKEHKAKYPTTQDAWKEYKVIFFHK